MVSEAQRRANDKYIRENYEFVKVRMMKGDKELLKERAKAEGKSLNQFILDRIMK